MMLEVGKIVKEQNNRPVQSYRVKVDENKTQKYKSGGEALVFYCTRESDGRNVVVRIPIQNDDDLKEEKNTGILTTHLKDPHIVDVLDYFWVYNIKIGGSTHDKKFCVVFPEYIPLNDYIFKYITDRTEKNRMDGIGLPLHYVIEFSQQIARGLSKIHQHSNGLTQEKLMHRDISSRNIFLEENSGKVTLKIGDFGLLRIYNATASIKSKQWNPGYMAPEFFRGKYGQSADIWAFGVIIVEMLTGCPPDQLPLTEGLLKLLDDYEQKRKNELDNISEWKKLKSYVQTFLCTNPDERYKIPEFLHDFQSDFVVMGEIPMISLTDGFDDIQRLCIESDTQKPLMITAGPGSGKVVIV
jgi:serine/threonine protein kinase